MRGFLRTAAGGWFQSPPPGWGDTTFRFYQQSGNLKNPRPVARPGVRREGTTRAAVMNVVAAAQDPRGAYSLLPGGASGKSSPSTLIHWPSYCTAASWPMATCEYSHSGGSVAIRAETALNGL